MRAPRRKAFTLAGVWAQRDNRAAGLPAALLQQIAVGNCHRTKKQQVLRSIYCICIQSMYILSTVHVLYRIRSRFDTTAKSDTSVIPTSLECSAAVLKGLMVCFDVRVHSHHEIQRWPNLGNRNSCDLTIRTYQVHHLMTACNTSSMYGTKKSNGSTPAAVSVKAIARYSFKKDSNAPPLAVLRKAIPCVAKSKKPLVATHIECPKK